MNANQISLVKIVVNAGPITSIIHCVKVYQSAEVKIQLLKHRYSVSECQCDPNASTSLECDANGHCACKDGFSGKKCNTCKGGFTGSKCDECKPNVIGDKCDACEPHYFNHPTCQGSVS